MSSYDYLSRLKNFAWAFLLAPLYALISLIAEMSWVLDHAQRGRVLAFSNYSLSVLMGIFMGLSFVIIQIMICFLPTCCHRKQVNNFYYIICSFIDKGHTFELHDNFLIDPYFYDDVYTLETHDNLHNRLVAFMTMFTP
jgi:hypothetical protein